MENEKTKKDAKSEKVKKQKSNTNLSEPKKATSVPRKSSTQSRSGHIMDEKEPMTTASRKREFRRSISSDSSLSSRPSSGTRETVAEKILRHHWPSITCVKWPNPYFQGEISKESWKRTCHPNSKGYKDNEGRLKDCSPQEVDSQGSWERTFKDEENLDICLPHKRWKQGKTSTEGRRKG